MADQRQSARQAEVDRAIVRYPTDARRADQLMTEAGFTRDRDGLFARGGERFKPDFWVTAGAQYERHQAIMVERQRQVIAMARILSQEVAAYPLYPNIGVRADVASLRGHEKSVVSTLPCWNVHEWTLS